ncbi:hypothetical protein MMC28_010509 [Mycoblastus sanguinarius]|nr:hypothetical protein [Mycoblastus sanguinarius]
MATPFELTEDGFELQWQTNYLAPFMLTNTLLPILESTAAGTSSRSRVRIVNVSAEAALAPGLPKELDLARPNLDYVSGTMAAWRRYGHSKIASTIHARALHNRLSRQGISAFSLHPGIIYTNLQAADTSIFPGVFLRYAVRWGIIPGVISPTDGARTTLFCATSPRAVENSGGYFMPIGKLDKRPDKWNNDDKLVGKLWDESERMLKEAGF